MAETDKDDLISIIEEDDNLSKNPNNPAVNAGAGCGNFYRYAAAPFHRAGKIDPCRRRSGRQRRFSVLATQKDPAIENPKPEEIYRIGTVGRILRMLKLPDGRVKALVQGVAKARIVRYVRKEIPVSGKDRTISRNTG